MINRTARRDDQRLSTLEQQLDYLRPHRRADLAHRVRQPETVAPARRAPPDPMAAPPARATPPVSPPALGPPPAVKTSNCAGQQVEEMIIAELAASLLQLDQRVQGLDQQRCDVPLPPSGHHHRVDARFRPSWAPSCSSRPATSASPQRRPPGRCSRPGAGPQRLRPTIRQPVTTAPLQPTCCGRSAICPQTSMMRAGPNRAFYLKKRAGGHTHARRHHPRPPPHRRPLGPPTPTVRSKLHSSTYSVSRSVPK